MLCEKPYTSLVGSEVYGCGRCLACRSARRRMWANRMLLEMQKHGDSCFVTLTYNDKYMTEGGSLEPVVVQQWIKRLRKYVQPRKIRYYLAGEYGDYSERPHYHAAVFGLDRMTAGGIDGLSGAVAATWQRGFTKVGELTPASAMYICGYVTKKIREEKDDYEKWLDNRYPEYARMSLRPGIGAGAMEDVARVLQERKIDTDVYGGDVPYSLRSKNKGMLFGKYLRGKLREYLGYESKDAPAAIQQEWASEMRKMRADLASDPENQGKSYQQAIVDRDIQKLRNIRVRSQRHPKRIKI